MQYINYLQEGGAAGAATQAVVNTLPYMIPVYGSYLSIKDAVEDPSWANIANAGISTVGDLLTIFGIGAGIKALATASKGAKAVSASRKATVVAREALNEASKTLDNTTKAYTKARQLSEAANLIPEAPLTKQLEMTRRATKAHEAVEAAKAAEKQTRQALLDALDYNNRLVWTTPTKVSDPTKLGVGTAVSAGTLIKPYVRELTNH